MFFNNFYFFSNYSKQVKQETKKTLTGTLLLLPQSQAQYVVDGVSGFRIVKQQTRGGGRRPRRARRRCRPGRRSNRSRCLAPFRLHRDLATDWPRLRPVQRDDLLRAGGALSVRPIAARQTEHGRVIDARPPIGPAISSAVAAVAAALLLGASSPPPPLPPPPPRTQVTPALLIRCWC